MHAGVGLNSIIGCYLVAFRVLERHMHNVIRVAATANSGDNSVARGMPM